MKSRSPTNLFASLICLTLLSGPALAQPDILAEPEPPTSVVRPIFLAAAEDGVAAQVNSSETPAVAPEAFEPPLFSGGKIHQYLGLATVGAAAATFLTHHDLCREAACVNQPRDTRGPHAQLGRATAVLALATVASGLLTHWDDFSLEDGWKDPDNMHVMLGVSGAALMAYAINKSWGSTVPVNHSGLAELGAASMVFAIKLTW